MRRQLQAYGRAGVDPALDAFDGLEEWCFHPPGKTGAKAAGRDPSEVGTYRMAHGKVYRLSNGHWEEVNSSGGG